VESVLGWQSRRDRAADHGIPHHHRDCWRNAYWYGDKTPPQVFPQDGGAHAPCKSCEEARAKAARSPGERLGRG